MEIYLDENLSEYVADALNSLNKGYFNDVIVYSTKIKFGKGEADEVIIPSIGKNSGIFITKDINIHKTRLQYQLCEQYKLGVFFIKMQKGFDKHWEIVKLLINSWEEILEKVNKEKLPFGYEIPVRGKNKKIISVNFKKSSQPYFNLLLSTPLQEKLKKVIPYKSSTQQYRQKEPQLTTQKNIF
jgi:hypothetical protein